MHVHVVAFPSALVQARQLVFENAIRIEISHLMCELALPCFFVSCTRTLYAGRELRSEAELSLLLPVPVHRSSDGGLCDGLQRGRHRARCADETEFKS